MGKKNIKIRYKSFAANSAKVYPFNLDYNMQVTTSHYSSEVFQQILAIPSLFSLVFNCHGSSAYLDIGSDGLSWDNIDIWKTLSSTSIKYIYFASCNIVSFGNKRDGNLFCGAVAKAAQANVIASSAIQDTAGTAPPKGYISPFNRPAWIWYKNGANAPWDN